MARLASCEPERVRRLVDLGLIAPRDGAFEQGDVTRVRLLAALEGSGVALEDLAAAVRAGRLSLRFAGQLIADPVALTDRAHAQALSALGLDPDLVQEMQLALGLPTSSPDDPIREDDLELYTLIARAREAGLGDESLLRILRVYGVSTQHIAEVQREHFKKIEEKLLAGGLSYAEMLDATAAKRIELQALAFRTVYLLLRRYRERSTFEDVVVRIEEILEEQHISRPAEQPCTIMFLDLTGYTRSTEQSGDERAAEHGARLVEIALDRSARHGGRLVKTLGDGVMLRFHAAGAASAAALEMVDRAAAAGLPPARAGIASGPAVQRDADYFGRTVNLAARLVDHAGPGQVLVAGQVTGGTERIVLEAAGSHGMEGFAEPVPVFRARWRDGS